LGILKFLRVGMKKITLIELKKRYHKYIAWGCGKRFETYNNSIPIDYAVDMDSKLWGQVKCGIEIKKPDSLVGESRNAVVIICVREFLDVIEFMKNREIHLDYLLPDMVIPNPFPFYEDDEGGRSYALYAEDAIISGISSRFGIPIRHYIDVGANMPIAGNATFTFYQDGSTGCLVEPNIVNVKALRKIRNRDYILQVGVSDEEHNDMYMDYYEFPKRNTLNTFDKERAKEVENMGYLCHTTKIRMMSLNSIIKLWGQRVIDYISIDVEKYEWNVLKDFRFDLYNVIFFNVEKGDSRVKNLMEKNNYDIAAETISNWIFIKRGIIRRI